MSIRVILSTFLLFIASANVFADEKENLSASIGCETNKVSRVAG
jgi:hypothetical protein